MSSSSHNVVSVVPTPNDAPGTAHETTSFTNPASSGMQFPTFMLGEELAAKSPSDSGDDEEEAPSSNNTTASKHRGDRRGTTSPLESQKAAAPSKEQVQIPPALVHPVPQGTGAIHKLPKLHADRHDRPSGGVASVPSSDSGGKDPTAIISPSDQSRVSAGIGVLRARDDDVVRNTNLIKQHPNISTSQAGGSPQISQLETQSHSTNDVDAPFPAKGVPKTVTLSSLKQQMKHGQVPPPCFALFGSFERARIFHELVTLCKDEKTLDFVIEVQSEAGFDDLPGETTFASWLQNPKEAPSEGYFSQPMIAWPLHTITTLTCYFQTALKMPFGTLTSLFKRGGIVSSGKGFLAAIAVALSENRDQFVKNCVTILKISVAVGALYQRHADTLLETTMHCPKQSFLLLLVNIPISALQLLITQANQVDTDDPQHRIPLTEIQICRVISQRSCVVCGHPLDLMRLDALLIEYANETGVKIHKDFLPAVVPENSPHHNQSLLLELIHVLKEEELEIYPSEFVAPVFSPVNGIEMNDSTSFMMEMAGALTCVPQDLTYSLQHLRETDTLFDFSVSELRIGQMIAWTKKSIGIVAVPADRTEASALPSPRRSAHRHVIRSTMDKCAVLNQIMNKIQYQGKPKKHNVSYLGSSFVDFGLLLDLDKMVEQMQTLISPNASVTSPNVLPSNLCGGIANAGQSLTSGPNLSVTGPTGPTRRKMMSMSISTVTAYVEPQGSSEVESKAYHSAQRNLVVMPPAQGSNVVNVYQVSPLIRYLELQHRCLLTQGAIDFAQMLSDKTKLPFPQYTLLMCPTVFALLELWDAYEFVDRLEKVRKEAREMNRGTHTNEYRSQAKVRGNQLKRILSNLRQNAGGANGLGGGATGHHPAPRGLGSPGEAHLPSSSKMVNGGM